MKKNWNEPVFEVLAISETECGYPYTTPVVTPPAENSLSGETAPVSDNKSNGSSNNGHNGGRNGGRNGGHCGGGSFFDIWSWLFW